MDQWYCTVEGTRYGPISAEELKTWMRDGRVKSNDLVWREGMDQWRAAGTVTELQSVASPSGSPLDELTSALSAPPPGGSAGRSKGVRRRLRPHRGGTILTLGILGLVCCWICGIIAWTMGNTDLREMDAKHMDPSGRGNTQAGRICGMIGVILGIVVIVFYALALALGAGFARWP